MNLISASAPRRRFTFRAAVLFVFLFASTSNDSLAASGWQNYGKSTTGFIQGGARHYMQYKLYRSPLTPPFGTAADASLGIYLVKDFGIFGSAAKGYHYPMTEARGGIMYLLHWFGFGGSSGALRRFAPQITLSMAKMKFDPPSAPYIYQQEHTVIKAGGFLFVFLGNEGREFLSFGADLFRLSSNWFITPYAGYGIRW